LLAAGRRLPAGPDAVLDFAGPITQREECAIDEQSRDQDGAQQRSTDEGTTPVAAEPVDDPWEGFPVDEYVYRSGG